MLHVRPKCVLCMRMYHRKLEVLVNARGMKCYSLPCKVKSVAAML